MERLDYSHRATFSNDEVNAKGATKEAIQALSKLKEVIFVLRLSR
ncbi:hypothetical protein [Sulfoacidibacillus ferrooxidans]|nr:hypothetical protein [Sulfoacidibacillus ferrooxidans]